MKSEIIFDEVLSMLNDRVDYKSITLGEVAKRCKMGKSTIYEYFASKDEMIFKSIVYYLNQIVGYFSKDFEISTFRVSMRAYIKALATTMKANFWLVFPWTFIDNYAPFLTQEDSDTITDFLYKSKDQVYDLFYSICERGEKDGVLYRIEDYSVNFAFNGVIATLAENIDSETDMESRDIQDLIEDLISSIVKQLN